MPNSFAQISGLGSPISEIGEAHPTYIPSTNMYSIYGNLSDVLFLYKTTNTEYVLVRIVKNPISLGFNIVNEISDTIIEINTCSDYNIIDLISKANLIGRNAYNGASIPIALTTGASFVSALYASTCSSDCAGGVDTGAKVLLETNALTIKTLRYSKFGNGLEIANYFNGNYSSSIADNSYSTGSLPYINYKKVGTLYIEDSIIPYPSGSQVSDIGIIFNNITAIREPIFAGYQLGNTLKNTYQAFMLFGQTYFFDGLKIYGVSLTAGNQIQSIVPLVDASGMTFICQTPTMVFFFSDFDNSLFTFDGGRSLTKQIRMSQKSAIVNGVYGVEENTLALKLTDNSLIFMRDGLMSQVATLGGDLRATVNGIILANSSGYTRYSYNTNTLSGEVQTIEPLILQTAFFGTDRNTLQSVSRYAIRLYSASKALTTVTITGYSFTQDGSDSQTQTFTVGDVSNPWDSDGYAFITYLPTKPRSMAKSIKIESSQKIHVLDLYATLKETDTNVIKNMK